MIKEKLKEENEETVMAIKKTIRRIHDDANGHLDSADLDDLKDCYKILMYIDALCEEDKDTAARKL